MSSIRKADILVVDLDGTLCSQEKTGSYHLALPKTEMIDAVNSCYDRGMHIIIFTARGMNTHNGNVEDVISNYQEMTEKWLKDNNVKHHELKFGKPSARYYIDDKAMTLEYFKEWHLEF